MREEKELVCIVSEDCICDSMKVLVNPQKLQHTIKVVEFFVGLRVCRNWWRRKSRAFGIPQGETEATYEGSRAKAEGES